MDTKAAHIHSSPCLHTQQQFSHPAIHASFSTAVNPTNPDVTLDMQHHACHGTLQSQPTATDLGDLEPPPPLLGLQAGSELADHLVTNISEKVPIYRHPLFPVLRLLFEKTELATNAIESITPGAFDVEIKRLVTQMARENKPFFTDNQEIDSLVLKAIQVLRIHLLELEKVNELCKDFCTRYISCLRGKLNSENIMKTLDIHNTPPASPTRSASTSSYSGAESSSQEQVTSETLTAQPVSSMTRTYSQDTSSVTSSSDNTVQVSRSNSVDSALNTPVKLNDIPLSDLTSGFLSKKGKAGKRGVLPKAAISVLKGWLFQHLVHPYPTEDEKKELAHQTNLSNLQVNNWFINARRRILQPMLESSSTFLKTNKKAKPQRSAAHKDWTNTIGVYNAYRTEALQNTATQTSSMGLLFTQSMVNNNTMLVDLEGHPQTVMVTQPLHFVHVTQVPLQTMSTATYIPIAQNTTLTSVMSTCQNPSIVVPLVPDKQIEQSVTGSFVASLNTPQINQ